MFQPEQGRPKLEMPVNLNSAYKKAEQVTAQNALRPESFVHPDGASQEMVNNDLAYVARRKEKFVDMASMEYKLAKAFEAALFERINIGEWFGKKVKMIMPSEYDDLANGMDGVLEIHEQQGSKNYLGLGIDVTYSKYPGEKFAIIKEQLDAGRLGTVKYFRNTDDTFEGRLKNVPHAIVLLNETDATRVVRDWDQAKIDNESNYRIVILRQLEMQLEAYYSYTVKLEQADGSRFKVSKYFESARRNISALLTEITKPGDRASLDSHPTIVAIRNQLKQFQVAG